MHDVIFLAEWVEVQHQVTDVFIFVRERERERERARQPSDKTFTPLGY